MKQIIYLTLGFGAVIALGIGLNHVETPHGTPTNSATPSNAMPAAQAPLQTVTPPSPLITKASSQPIQSRVSIPTAIETEESLAYRQAIETLLSPQTAFDQKQAAWKQLRDTGKLDAAISDLEKRVADNTNSVEDTVALGEAYLKKCGQTDDIRERASLAMKADQVLDTALGMDPSNWEAQFYKVSAMAKWPLELNQAPKVFDQFQALIQEQESQPAQSQFALTYVRLGDFYEKTGDATAAVQIWQRGAALFPDNSDLQEKLSPAR